MRKQARRSRPDSAAADGDHDLEPVAVGEPDLGMARLGHDLAVTLDGHPFADEATLIEQRKDSGVGRQHCGLAIDGELDHGDAEGGGG